eukprot:6853766-Prymnesium_polylepis.1
MLKDALSNARMVTTPHAQSPFNAYWVPCVPCIFVQMGHQLVPGGVAVGPAARRCKRSDSFAPVTGRRASIIIASAGEENFTI